MWTKTFIRNHIAKLKDDAIFTTREMLGYGKRAYVDWALWEMVHSGEIIRVAWGVFVKCNHPAPDTITEREVAGVKAAAFGKRLMSEGADVACEQGLPAAANDVAVYQTDGRSTKFRHVLRKTWVFLKGTSARKMRLGDEKIGAAVRGLWHLKEEKCTESIIRRVLRKMNRTEREDMQLSIRWMPSWLSDSSGLPYGIIRLRHGEPTGNLIVKEAEVRYMVPSAPLLRLAHEQFM